MRGWGFSQSILALLVFVAAGGSSAYGCGGTEHKGGSSREHAGSEHPTSKKTPGPGDTVADAKAPCKSKDPKELARSVGDHTPTSPPNPSGPSAYRDAGDMTHHGRNSALASAGSARNAASYSSALASADRSLASSIGRAYSQISGYSQPLISSPDPQLRNQGQQYLSQPAQAPDGREQEFKDLEMSTNRDVLDKGPEYQDNLEKSADANDKEAKSLEKLADQAEAAADKMKSFSDTTKQRDTNIESVSDQTILAASHKGGGKMDNTLVDEAGRGTGADGKLAANGVNDGMADPTGKIADAGGSKLSGAATSGGKDGDPGYSAGGGRRPSSLSDQLKDALADGSGKNGAGKDDPKSEFDGFFAKKNKNGDGKDGKDSSVTDREKDIAVANAHGGFSLAGSDTDRAVKGLLGGIQGADEDRRVFGDIDQTIFARMKKYLTKAQADKKVGN